MKIKLFADGATIEDIQAQQKLGIIDGFTTNPTLMRRSGVTNYEAWAKQVLAAEPFLPVSFEVLSDDFDEMERQALKIASWGDNVYVKIPVINSLGYSSADLIQKLNKQIKLNVTAVTTYEQIEIVTHCLKRGLPAILSIFAGRIADTGENPRGYVVHARSLLPTNVEILWASTRELFNIVQAASAGCDIITVPGSILDKLSMIGKNLDMVSLEMVKQFHDDAIASGYTL